MSKRDSFPPRTAASRGRVNLQRTNLNPSQEPLSAHPLLSSTPQHQEDQEAATAAQPRYVPYTPRQQRLMPSTTSSASAAQVVSAAAASPHSHGATGKLQLVNLKAAAQGLGLDTGSVGWAILEKLVGSGMSDSESEEWSEIWNAVTTGKATLLLPLDPASTHDRERITPEFVKDHVVLCDVPSPSADPTSTANANIGSSASSVRTLWGSRSMVSLSGLRGVLDEETETLTFRSSLHNATPAFQGLLEPATRTAALNRLPPLPILPTLPQIRSLHHSQFLAPSSPSTTSSAPASPGSSPVSHHPHKLPSASNSLSQPPYPTYALPTHAFLPLPPRPMKPPLPPRPALSPARNAPTVSTGSVGRMSGFASLFGVKSSAPSTPSTPSALPISLVGSPASATVSLESHGEGDPLSPASGLPQAHTPTIDVSAYAISHRIVRDDIAKQISRGVKGELAASLAEANAPGWVTDRVGEFIGGMMPLVKSGKGVDIQGAGEKGKGRVLTKPSPGGRDAVKEKEKGAAKGKYVVNALEETMEELSEQFQDFYGRLEDELGSRGVRHAPSGEDGGREGETDRQRREREEEEKEARVRKVMEVVEAGICELFYDRLFLQPTSDDPTHDEALSSRVAALNMLDLGLEHLDVDVSSVGGPKAAEGVDIVVRACGETLSQLDAVCRSPGDKAAVLVAAHKVVVDGLAKLPPVKLKSEESKTPEPPLKVDISEKEVHLPAPLSLVAPASSTTLVTSPTSDVPSVTLSHIPSENDHLARSSSPSPSPHTRSPSPRLTISPPPPDATPVSGDILLPLIIFSVVKANPAHLVSHLLYTQRFRNQRVGGEESYCMINLMAVAEFLENVDLAALGLKDSEKKLISAADLTPIPLVRTPDSPAFPNLPSLRGRMEQQVDAIAGSANKVLLGVVDTSFGVLRSLLPGSTPQGNIVTLPEDSATSASWNSMKPGFGLLRRESGFSIASLAASLPGNRARSVYGEVEEAGQQLVTVSRPGSIKSAAAASDGEVTDSEDRSEEDGSGDEDEQEDEEEDETSGGYDTRSIKSFESMMTGSARERKEASERKSLSDRLANMSGLSRLAHGQAHKGSPPASRRSSLLPPAAGTRFDSPSSSRPQSPISIRLAPPNRRFVECHEDDLKVSEISELLREYKRIVEGVRAMGGFEE